jgi:hypothetical protein
MTTLVPASMVYSRDSVSEAVATLGASAVLQADRFCPLMSTVPVAGRSPQYRYWGVDAYCGVELVAIPLLNRAVSIG